MACGGNRTVRGAETQQILASVLRTLDQRGLDPADVFTPLLQARRAIVAPALQTPSASTEPLNKDECNSRRRSGHRDRRRHATQNSVRPQIHASAAGSPRGKWNAQPRG